MNKNEEPTLPLLTSGGTGLRVAGGGGEHQLLRCHLGLLYSIRSHVAANHPSEMESNLPITHMSRHTPIYV